MGSLDFSLWTSLSFSFLICELGIIIKNEEGMQRSMGAMYTVGTQLNQSSGIVKKTGPELLDSLGVENRLRKRKEGNGLTRYYGKGGSSFWRS